MSDAQEQSSVESILTEPTEKQALSVQHTYPRKRRERRPLSRTPKTSPLVGVINSFILVIGLCVILASRCEQGSTAQEQDHSWINSLITPKDLHLPKSVTDKLLEKKKQAQDKIDSSAE